MSEVSVVKVRERKMELEKEISKMLNQFEIDCGVSIRNMELREHEAHNQVGHSNWRHLYVVIEVPL